MVKLVNQCHPVKLPMEDAIQWQFVFLMELEEWFNVSAAPDLQVGEKKFLSVKARIFASCNQQTFINLHKLFGIIHSILPYN